MTTEMTLDPETGVITIAEDGKTSTIHPTLGGQPDGLPLPVYRALHDLYRQSKDHCVRLVCVIETGPADARRGGHVIVGERADMGPFMQKIHDAVRPTSQNSK
jgi:hypothetical protein